MSSQTQAQPAMIYEYGDGSAAYPYWLWDADHVEELIQSQEDSGGNNQPPMPAVVAYAAVWISFLLAASAYVTSFSSLFPLSG